MIGVLWHQDLVKPFVELALKDFHGSIVASGKLVPIRTVLGPFQIKE